MALFAHMAADPAPDPREELHRLIDQLPEAAVGPVVWLLRHVQDPMIAVLDVAPEDDEPLTPEDEAAIAQARERYERGEAIPVEQLIRELDEADD
jgi:hypothetical protein